MPVGRHRARRGHVVGVPAGWVAAAVLGAWAIGALVGIVCGRGPRPAEAPPRSTLRAPLPPSRKLGADLLRVERGLDLLEAIRGSTAKGRAAAAEAHGTKFIVLAHQRSGSTFVMDHLKQRLFGYGAALISEPFNPGTLVQDGWSPEEVETLYIGEVEASWALFRRRLDEVFETVRAEFADDWRGEPGYAAGAIRPRAVGFKLMKNQVSKVNYGRLLEWAKSEGRVKIVHLLRANTIEQMLSVVTSRVTGTFHARDQATVEETRAREREQEDRVTADLLAAYSDPRAIANKFNNQHCWTDWFIQANDEALPKSAHMEVVYEVLTAEATKRSAFDAVMEFLGLDSAEAAGAERVFGLENPYLKDLMRIHGTREPRERVSNWDDWRAALDGTLALQISEDPAVPLSVAGVVESKSVFSQVAGPQGAWTLPMEEVCPGRIESCRIALCAERRFEARTAKWDRPAEVKGAPEARAAPAEEGYFRSGAWLEPGRRILETIRGAERLERMLEGVDSGDYAAIDEITNIADPTEARPLAESLVAGAGDWDNWVAVTEPDGNQYHLLKAPLNRDGTLGAATAKASPGCANLYNLFANLDPTVIDELYYPGAASILWPAIVCVDVDMGAESPVVLSTPSFSGWRVTPECLEYPACNVPMDLIDEDFDAAEFDFMTFGHFQDRGIRHAAGFLLGAVLPRMPAHATGSFVISTSDITPSQPPKESVQQLFYRNRTPFVLHGLGGFSPWTGAMPDADTLRGIGDQKIRSVLRGAPRPWSEKRTGVLFRGRPHGQNARDPAYEHRLEEDELSILVPGSLDLDAATWNAVHECIGTSERLELAVWANSPNNARRDLVDVQLTGWDSPRSKGGHLAKAGCRDAAEPELYGLPREADVQFISDTQWGDYKAFFVVDGHGAAFSLRNKLALDAVMLKMESPLVQEIERVVLPGVHYMPFTMQNVSEVVRYVLAEENAAEMQAMVRRAHTALAEELTLEKGAERMRDDLVRLWAGTGATPAAASVDAPAEDPPLQPGPISAP